MQILDTNFPPHHKIHKIINRNTVKISYSCMPNVALQIASHNRNLIRESKRLDLPTPKKCDCKKADSCPLNGHCKQSAVIYKADINPEVDDKKSYIGVSEGPIKERISDHRTSCRYDRYRNKTKLSAFVWEKKDIDQKCDIEWSVTRKSTSYRAGSKRCNLCLWEKFHIMKERNELVNERNELVTKC